jgi:hypothetical protein
LLSHRNSWLRDKWKKSAVMIGKSWFSPFDFLGVRETTAM